MGYKLLIIVIFFMETSWARDPFLIPHIFKAEHGISVRYENEKISTIFGDLAKHASKSVLLGPDIKGKTTIFL